MRPTDVRARIRELTGLAVSIGIGRTKLVAKLASDAGKPDGLLVVEPADEDDFLLPLPVRAVPGIGPATAAALERLDVRTVADLRRQPLDILTMTVGESSGVNLFRLARGIDPRPVAPSGERKSVGAERTFAQDIFGDGPDRRRRRPGHRRGAAPPDRPTAAGRGRSSPRCGSPTSPR